MYSIKPTGKVIYNDFNTLTCSDINVDINNLKEDLLQIEYPENIILDVGWYPSFSINGAFTINIIRDYNWDIPIKTMRIKYCDISECLDVIIDELNMGIL